MRDDLIAQPLVRISGAKPGQLGNALLAMLVDARLRGVPADSGVDGPGVGDVIRLGVNVSVLGGAL